MQKDPRLEIVLKVSAIMLWSFTPLYLLIVSDFGSSLLKPGTFWGDLLIRAPYQWDYELMFTGLYLVWGISVWKATKNTERNMSIIKFTAWGFLAIVATNILVGLFRTHELIHLTTDSIPWLILGILILILSKKNSVSKI